MMEMMNMMLGFGLFVYAIIFALFILWVWALVDIIISKFQEDLMQVIWFLVVFFLPFLGVLLYLLVGRAMKRTNDVIPEDLNQKYEQLAKIKKLLDNGAISEAEFDAEKQKILNRKFD